MKKKFFTFLCLVLAVVMVAGITGCSPEQTTATQEPTSTQDPAPTQDAAQADQPTEAPVADENFNPGWPVVNETVQLTGFGKKQNGHADWNDLFALNEGERITNVDIVWDLAPSQGFEEAKSVLLASGDYPDIFWGCDLTRTELSTYGQMGVFADLTEAIENYAHNFMARVEQYPDIAAQTKFEGKYYSMPRCNPPESPSNIDKFWINEKFLEQLDLPVPDTTEEYHQTMLAFVQQDANGNGDPSDEYGISSHKGAFTRVFKFGYGSFGLGTLGASLFNDYIDLGPDGVIRCFATTDNYYQLLSWFASMYADGCMDPEMFTQDNANLTAKLNDHLIGAIPYNPNNGILGTNKEDYITTRVLTGPNGDKQYVMVSAVVSSVGAFAMSAQSEYIREGVRWSDYWYSDEGNHVLRLGTEGVTYEKKEDGSYGYTDWVLNNPDGLTQAQALGTYAPDSAGGDFGTFIVPEGESIRFTERVNEAYDIVLQDYDPNMVIAAFSYTAEEQDVLNTIATDIQTYIGESTVAFVTGKTELTEESFADYVETLEKMSLADYVAVYQAAYERYIAK